MKWYLQAIKNYATFSGRASRKEYWMFVLFNMIFCFIAMIVDNLFGTAAPELGYGLFYILYALFAFLPGFAVCVRRLHDINKSGWMLLISLIPIIGAIWLIVLCIKEGDHGDNNYGLEPNNN